jgi:hypothetical protein
MKDEFYTKVVGTSKKNEDDESIQKLLKDISEICYEGELLSLEHESDNPYDENAIKVYYDFDHIGYIRRELAEDLAPLVDQQRVEAELCEITGGEDGKSFGCNILIRIVPEGETARTDSREYVHLGAIKNNNLQRDTLNSSVQQSSFTPWETPEKDWADKIAPILPLVYVLWFCGIAAGTFFLLSLIFK